MSIPMWMYKDYSDDGCSVYECLNCYNTWEARTDPTGYWKFCPVCGIEWTGEKKSERPEWKRRRDTWLDNQPIRPCIFYIEKRVCDKEGPIIEDWRIVPYIRTNARKQLVQELKRLKQEDADFREEVPDWDLVNEYRIVHRRTK